MRNVPAFGKEGLRNADFKIRGYPFRDLKRGGNRMASILKVKGMSCQHCVMSVTKALSQLEGIKNVQVDLVKEEIRFDNTEAVAVDRIKKAITDAGYEVIHT
jgi:copper ion binding protein